MTDFFASLFESWGLNPLYATDLGEHLRGYNLQGTYDGTPWYSNIGWILFGSTLLIFALQYFIINSSRFNRAWHWWVMALILASINFGTAFTIPYNDLNSGNINTHLHVTISDCIGFGVSSAIWSIILLGVVTITPLKKLSSQCRNTTFWKP